MKYKLRIFSIFLTILLISSIVSANTIKIKIDENNKTKTCEQGSYEINKIIIITQGELQQIIDNTNNNLLKEIITQSIVLKQNNKVYIDIFSCAKKINNRYPGGLEKLSQDILESNNLYEESFPYKPINNLWGDWDRIDLDGAKDTKPYGEIDGYPGPGLDDYQDWGYYNSTYQVIGISGISMLVQFLYKDLYDIDITDFLIEILFVTPWLAFFTTMFIIEAFDLGNLDQKEPAINPNKNLVFKNQLFYDILRFFKKML